MSEHKSLFAQIYRAQNNQSHTWKEQYHTHQEWFSDFLEQPKSVRHLTLCRYHKLLALHKVSSLGLPSFLLLKQHFDNSRNSEPNQCCLQESLSDTQTTSVSYLKNQKCDNSILPKYWDLITEIKFVRNDFFYDFHVPIWNHYEAHGIYHHNSGKTKSLLMKLIDLAHRNAGYAGGLYAPTAELARDVLIPELDEILEQIGIKYDYWSAPNPRYKLHFKEGSTTILVRSMENWKRIVGNNFAFACIDEIDTIKQDVAEIAWKKIMGRMRAGNVRQIATTSTPEGFKFLYKWFVKEAKPGRSLIQAKTTDNPYLPDDFIEDLRNNYDPQLIEAYMNGQFVNLTCGTVYSNFDRNLNTCHEQIIKPGYNGLNEKTRAGDTLHIGMDFNVNHMAGIVVVTRNGLPRVVDEIVELEDTPAMIRAIQSRYKGHNIIVYPDASGGNTSSKNASVSDIALLKQAGLKVKVDSTNPSVKDRVATVQAAFLNAKDERRLLINEENCPTLIECLEQQVWNDKGEPDKTQGLDHALDALGYVMMYLLPIKKPIAAGIQIEAVW
jgi:PBSX family phage terminase large subunit